MPELPEVETICRGLRTQLLSRRIERVEVRSADVIHQKDRTPEDFTAVLEKQSILAVERVVNTSS